MTAELKLVVDLDANAVEAYLQGESFTSDLVTEVCWVFGAKRDSIAHFLSEHGIRINAAGQPQYAVSVALTLPSANRLGSACARMPHSKGERREGGSRSTRVAEAAEEAGVCLHAGHFHDGVPARL